MEAGGGTRLGSRSSTRHGPATVFSGPVRRWKKAWAPIASPNPSPAASKVLLYKWIPAPPSALAGAKDEATEESTNVRPIRYLPVSVVLGQIKQTASEAAENTAQASISDEKDFNDEASEQQVLPDASTNSGDNKESVEDAAMGNNSSEKSEPDVLHNGHGGSEPKPTDTEMQEPEKFASNNDENANMEMDSVVPSAGGVASSNGVEDTNMEMDSMHGAEDVKDGEG